MKRSIIALLIAGGMLACADSTAVKGPRVYDVVVEMTNGTSADYSSNPPVCRKRETSWTEVGTLSSLVLDSAGAVQSGPVDFIVTRTNSLLADVSHQGKLSLLGDSVRLWWGIRNGNPDEGHTNFYGRRLPSGVLQGAAKVLTSGGMCTEFLAGTFKATPR
jgi:hypothetical protein